MARDSSTLPPGSLSAVLRDGQDNLVPSTQNVPAAAPQTPLASAVGSSPAPSDATPAAEKQAAAAVAHTGEALTVNAATQQQTPTAEWNVAENAQLNAAGHDNISDPILLGTAANVDGQHCLPFWCRIKWGFVPREAFTSSKCIF